MSGKVKYWKWDKLSFIDSTFNRLAGSLINSLTVDETKWSGALKAA